MAIYGRRRGGFANTVRLGLRLARAGGRVRMALVVLGALVGSVLILLALSFQNAVTTQAQRGLEREAYFEPVEIPEDEYLEALSEEIAEEDVYYGPEMLPINEPDRSSNLHITWLGSRALGLSESATVLAFTGDGPAPPGIPSPPSPSQAYVSPALKEILTSEREAPEAIAGKELLEISRAGLNNPNELLAYIGTSTSEYPGDLAEESPVLSWGVKWSDGSSGYTPTSDMIFPVFAFLLAPAVVLLATTTRLASSVRTERMAALRLLGVSRRRTQLIAGIEAGVLAFLGLVLGLIGLVPIARLTEGINVFGFSWFASDFRPSTPLLIATIVFVPLVTALTALVVLRKVSQNPLQIRRKAANPRPSYWRLTPLVFGVLLLTLQAAGVFKKLDTAGGVTAYAFLLGAVLIGSGILFAVPVAVRRLAGLLGRSTSRSTLLLAARRTQYEPAVLNRLVAGLVLVLFIGTAGQAVVLAFESTPQYRHAHAAITGDSTTMQVSSAEDLAPADRLTAAEIAALPGVSGVFEFSEISTSEYSDDVGKNPTISLITSCEDLARFGEYAGECTNADVYRLRDWQENTFAIELPSETRELGYVEHFLDFEPNYAAGYYSLLFPPNSPLLADLATDINKQWLVDLPADSQAWAEFETALAAESPAYWLNTPDLSPLDDVENVRTIIWIGTGIAGSIALITLLITAVDNGIARRPQISMQRAFGVSLSRVRRTQALQALLPLAVGVPLAGAAGILTGQAYISLDEMTITTSYWSAIGVAFGLAALAALLDSLATLPAPGGKITARSLRRE